MTSLQNSPTLHRTLLHNSFPQKHATFRSPRRDAVSFTIKAAQEPSASLTSQDRQRRRQVIAIGTIAPLVFLINQHSNSFAAENKKGFLSVLDQKDGYSFLYPFGWQVSIVIILSALCISVTFISISSLFIDTRLTWKLRLATSSLFIAGSEQEVVIEGQDKVFKDVIEPLESVSVNVIPTGKQDVTEFGSPQEVAETLIKKVLAPSNQKTKIIEAKEQDVEGKKYYQFEFIAKAPNYTRHALSTVSIGNGKFYTLTTGANERRWEKMKDRLQIVIESFKIFDV